LLASSQILNSLRERTCKREDCSVLGYSALKVTEVSEELLPDPNTEDEGSKLFRIGEN
jgi:hypothetical protein